MATLVKALVNLPNPRRGYAYQAYANGKKGDRMTYTNGKSVFLRSLEDPTEAVVVAGEHKANVNVAVFSPNGEWVASGDAEGRVLIWGQKNFSIKSDFPINKEIQDIAWGPDGTKVVAVGTGGEGMARVVAWDTGSNVGTLRIHSKTILSCDYSPERPFRIVTGAEDFSAAYYEGPPFKLVHQYKGANYVNKIKFSPDGQKFVSVSSDRKILAYETKTGTLIKEFESKESGHGGAIYSFAWKPDSTKFITCGADKTAKVWNYESGEVETTFEFGDTVNDMQQCALWHGDYLLTISLSGAINYLDFENPTKPKRIIKGHKEPLTDIAVDLSSKAFYTSDSSGVVSAWRDHEAHWFSGAGHGRGVVALGLTADKTQLVSVGLDDSIRFSDCKSLEFGSPIALGGSPTALACAKTHSDLAVVVLATNKLVIVRGGSTTSIPIPEKPMSVQFNPTDSHLAVSFGKGLVKVYKVEGTSIVEDYDIKDHEKPVTKVEWSPCGKYLLTTGNDRRILVHEGQKVLNNTDWEFHNGGVVDVAFSPSGSKVASVGNDLMLFIWKDTTAWGTERLKTDLSHREGIIKVAWLDEETVITLGADRCVKIWKV